MSLDWHLGRRFRRFGRKFAGLWLSRGFQRWGVAVLLLGGATSPLLHWWGPPQPLWSAKLASGEMLVAISVDGRTLTTQTKEGAFRFWDPTSGRRLPAEVRPGTQHRSAFALSADGERAAAVELGGEQSELAVVETSTGASLLRLPLRPSTLHPEGRVREWKTTRIEFSPDGGKVAVAGTDISFSLLTTQVVDIAGKSIEFQEAAVGHSGRAPSLCFARDGSSLLHSNAWTTGERVRYVPKWEWVELAGKRKRTTPTPMCDSAGQAAFLDDDRVIVGNAHGSEREAPPPGKPPRECKSVQICDAATAEVVGVFPGEQWFETSPDGKAFLTRTDDGPDGVTRIRSAVSGKVLLERANAERDGDSRLVWVQSGRSPTLLLTWQGLFDDRGDPLRATKRSRRSWWSYTWLYRSQANMIDAASGRVIRAVCGWGNSQITPDGCRLFTQTGDTWGFNTPEWLKGPAWTLFAYDVETAMPWRTAIPSALAVAGIIVAVSQIVVRRWSRPPVAEEEREVKMRVCPSCGESTPARAVRCYHCNALMRRRARSEP